MLRRKHLPLLYTRSHITRWQLVNFAVVKHFGKAQRRQRIGLVIGRQRQQAANAIEVDFIDMRVKTIDCAISGIVNSCPKAAATAV